MRMNMPDDAPDKAKSVLTGKVNLGRGLLRLYLVVWMLIAVATLVGGHREALTYLGSTYWNAEKVVQRQKLAFNEKYPDCTSKECLDQAFFQEFPESSQVVDPQNAKESVELFGFLVLVVPAALLLVLVVIFKMLAWAVAGFRTN